MVEKERMVKRDAVFLHNMHFVHKNSWTCFECDLLAEDKPDKFHSKAGDSEYNKWLQLILEQRGNFTFWQ